EFFRDDAAECRNLTNDCRIQRAAGLSVVLRREVNQRAAMEGANQRGSGCPYVHAAREQSLRQIEVGVDLLDFEKINADFNLSKTLFPRGVDVWAPRASLVRSLHGGALVHFPAQYHTQAGRALNTAIVREIPAFGSIVAKELDHERRDTDTFPTYMSFDMWNIRCSPIGLGM